MDARRGMAAAGDGADADRSGDVNLDPVVYDWARIKSATLVFGGADDFLAGTPANFQARMKYISHTVPRRPGQAPSHSGLGHVPHLESPEKTYPPLVAFLKEGISAR